ncbi:MAG: AAA family ATPase, partial [Actinomycetota bacterium]
MSRPEISLYRRNAAYITSVEVHHPAEKERALKTLPLLHRRRSREHLQSQWRHHEKLAASDATRAIEAIQAAIDALDRGLKRLAALKLPELLGKVEEQQTGVRAAGVALKSAGEALSHEDFGAAGGAVEEAARRLWALGGTLVVTLNHVLGQAAVGKEARERLAANGQTRHAAKVRLAEVKGDGAPNGLIAAAQLHALEAEGIEIVADILSTQVRPQEIARKAKVGRDGASRVVPPQELETFGDVGGLDDVKQQLRDTVGAILERPDEAARYRVVHNGILFHGPPGTGKTLLSRALAGEYGMKYIRFSPASIASSYIHEAAANLQALFELASDNLPCVLFLDEIDTIASARDDQPSADHREVVTQLMNSLEEYRRTQGLLIVAATNNVDRLDPGLREGRFDAKILIPLPDPEARADVLRVHLERRRDAVDWSGVELKELARITHGRNAAALESFVSLAAQSALRKGHAITHEALLDAIRQREGKDRTSLEEPVRWDEVVLADETRGQLGDILNIFALPDLARNLGVKPPAGILLHGPPGTGKTTIARAMASELQASFYEQSAADLLSKWVGESEERVAKLFAKARVNRPSIIFIDEIDSLLRNRSAQSTNPWEERVVSQFLRELDGLQS